MEDTGRVDEGGTVITPQGYILKTRRVRLCNTQGLGDRVDEQVLAPEAT